MMILFGCGRSLMLEFRWADVWGMWAVSLFLGSLALGTSRLNGEKKALSDHKAFGSRFSVRKSLFLFIGPFKCLFHILYGTLPGTVRRSKNKSKVQANVICW